jgi:uncharacterized membrane protein
MVELENVKTEILVAWIFALLALIGWIIGFLWELATGISIAISMASMPYIGLFGAGLFSSLFFVGGIAFFILIIPTILVFQRTSRMRGAANRGDIEELGRLNSVGWAIAALIFSGVIPGIMLLIAHSPIERLSTVTPTRIMETGPSMEDLERLSKLKSLLDSGVITKEEFESQKSLVLHPPSMQSIDPLQAQLTKLKSLYDSGALTEAEYNQQKRKLLTEV